MHGDRSIHVMLAITTTILVCAALYLARASAIVLLVIFGFVARSVGWL